MKRFSSIRALGQEGRFVLALADMKPDAPLNDAWQRQAKIYDLVEKKPVSESVVRSEYHGAHRIVVSEQHSLFIVPIYGLGEIRAYHYPSLEMVWQSRGPRELQYQSLDEGAGVLVASNDRVKLTTWHCLKTGTLIEKKKRSLWAESLPFANGERGFVINSREWVVINYRNGEVLWKAPVEKFTIPRDDWPWNGVHTLINERFSKEEPNRLFWLHWDEAKQNLESHSIGDMTASACIALGDKGWRIMGRRNLRNGEQVPGDSYLADVSLDGKILTEKPYPAGLRRELDATQPFVLNGSHFFTTTGKLLRLSDYEVVWEAELPAHFVLEDW
jgi:hypothetical protein